MFYSKSDLLSRIRKGPIKMLGRPLRVPWAFCEQAPSSFEEGMISWLTENEEQPQFSSDSFPDSLPLSLSLSSNTYIVCRETESIQWPQKETPFTSRQLGRPSVQLAFLLTDGFLCEAWVEASGASTLSKKDNKFVLWGVNTARFFRMALHCSQHTVLCIF